MGPDEETSITKPGHSVLLRPWVKSMWFEGTNYKTCDAKVLANIVKLKKRKVSPDRFPDAP